MNCKISCSFGEVIDKVTILTIKKEKALDSQALMNIQKELELIESDNELVKTKDKLFDTLFKTNLKLWELEDKIRQKSENKDFDADYIQCAEFIHSTNDLRYQIKRKINEKYNSLIKEEKIYQNHTNNHSTNDKFQEDIAQLEKGKHMYTNGEYEASLSILEKVVNKYKNCKKHDAFFIDLLFSYENICSVHNIKNKYISKIDKIMKNIASLSISKEQKVFCESSYSLFCLTCKSYKNAYPHIHELDFAERNKKLNGKKLNRYNMSFFKKDDKNKGLLLYNGGGIGDGFMYARFIPVILKRFPNSKITLICEERTCWIYTKAFRKYNSVVVRNYNDENIPHFDYHCSMISLIKYLNIEYDNVPFSAIFDTLETSPSFMCKQILSQVSVRNTGCKTYIFNWKGSKNNNHERKNRMLELENAHLLFKMKNVNWIIVTKDITDEEKDILDQYKSVTYYGGMLDKNHTYIDTVCIMKQIDGVISTDTSMLHLSANMNIKTYALLTLGCEWRWGRKGDKTNWYPSVKLFRQDKLGDWSNVISNLIDDLQRC